jgi:hypothetical protein
VRNKPYVIDHRQVAEVEVMTGQGTSMNGFGAIIGGAYDSIQAAERNETRREAKEEHVTKRR